MRGFACLRRRRRAAARGSGGRGGRGCKGSGAGEQAPPLLGRLVSLLRPRKPFPCRPAARRLDGASALTPALLRTPPPPPLLPPARRKDREAKKFGKAVQAEKKKERDSEKKRAITQVSKLRKDRKKSVSRQSVYVGC